MSFIFTQVPLLPRKPTWNLKTTPCEKSIIFPPKKKSRLRLRRSFFAPYVSGGVATACDRCGRCVRATAMAVAATGCCFCFALRGYGGGSDATCNENLKVKLIRAFFRIQVIPYRKVIPRWKRSFCKFDLMKFPMKKSPTQSVS